MLTTATSPEGLTNAILDRFSIKDCLVIRAMTARPEISYKMTMHAREALARSSLKEELQSAMQAYEPNMKALVFCRARWTADELAHELNCDSYHKDKPADVLQQTWKRFTSSATPCVLVCTSSVGVGVDVQGVRNVWHYGMPWSLIDCVQKSGRGGRDGGNATSHVLAWKAEFDSASTNCTEQDLRRLVCQTAECKRTIIAEVLDGHPTSTGWFAGSTAKAWSTVIYGSRTLSSPRGTRGRFY